MSFALPSFVRKLFGAKVRGRSHALAIPTAVVRENALGNGLEELDQARPQDVIGFGSRLAAACLDYGARRRSVAGRVIRHHPEAAWLFSSDGDGHIREAAVNALEQPATSVGRFVALVLRLNDWAPQVRRAAVAAAERVFPATPADIIAAAAPYVLRQRFQWKRWGAAEAEVLDLALARADVAVALGGRLMNGRTGALGTTLRNALRLPSLDGQLLRLATDAYLPPVRAQALQTLLQGRATWVVGYEWLWIDKAYSVQRRAPRVQSREIIVTMPRDELIRAGVADRSAAVRRVAASALIAHADQVPDAVELAGRLLRDPSPAVRFRAEFLLKAQDHS